MNRQSSARHERPGNPTTWESLLLNVARQIHSSSDIKTIFETATDEVRRLLQTDRALIYRREADGGWRGVASSPLLNWANFPAPIGLISGWEPIAIADFQNADIAAHLKTSKIGACVILPIHIEGDVGGLLVVCEDDKTRDWQSEEIHRLETLCLHLAIAIRQDTLLERNRHLRHKLDRQSQLAGILEIAEDAIVCVDESDHITRFNQGAVRLFGYSREEAIGRPLDILLPERFAQSHRRHVREFRNSDDSARRMGDRDVTIWARHKDGREFPAEASISRFDSGGEVILTVILRDISDRKRAETALKTSEAQLRSILNSAFTTSIVNFKVFANRDWKYNYQSDGCEALFGYTAAEILADKNLWMSRVWPEDRERVILPLFDRFFAEEPASVEYRFRHRDGSIRWIAASYTAVWDEGGECWNVTGISADISDRKRMETLLAESEARFRTLVGNLPGAIYRCACDENWTMEFISAAIADISGYKPEELIQNRVRAYASLIHPDDSLTVETGVSEAIARRQPFILEYRIVHRDGGIRWVYEKGQGKFDAGGNLLWLDGAIFDISDRKAAEVALKEKTKELDRFFSLSLDLLCIADLEGHFLRLNQHWEATLGYPLQELEGTSFLDFVHPDDLAPTLDAIAELSQQHPVINFVNRYRCQDRSYRWIEWRSTPGGNRIYAAARDITEHKRTERRLRDLSDRLSLAVKSAAIGIWEWDIVRNLLIWDDRMYELYGVKRSEFGGAYDAWVKGIHPDDRQHADRAIASALAGEKEFDTEFRVLHPDGTVRCLKAYGLVQRDERGEPRRMIGINFDISDRKRMEAALRESEERWQFAFEGNGDGVWDWNAQTDTVFFSRRWKEILGFEEWEIGDDLSEWKTRIHPDDKAEVFAVLEKHLNGETARYVSEHRVRCKDGSYKWILDRGRMIDRTPDGKPLRAIGTHTDIGDRKQTELALQESEEKFRQLAENIRQVFFMTSTTGEMLYISPAYEEIWQRSRESLYEDPRHWLLSVHPEERAAIGEMLTRHIRDGEIFNETYRILRADGEIRWIEARSFPVRNDNGDIYRYTGIAEDITDRKQAEDALHNQLQKILLLQQITDKIRQSLDVNEIFQTAARAIGEAFQVNCCLIHTYTLEPIPRASLMAKYSKSNCRLLDALESEISLDGNADIEALMRQDRAIAFQISTFLGMQCAAPHRGLVSPILASIQELDGGQTPTLKSMLAIATFYRGKPNGIISLHQCEYERNWSADEIELIEAVAPQLGIAIAQTQLLCQEQQQRQELLRKNVTLKRITREAEAANRAKSEFLANMSHEIRTPMNAVLGFADLLQSMIADPTARSYVDAIASSGRTLLALINDILDLSKIEAGKLQIHCEPVEIRAIVWEIQQIFLQKAIEKNLQLHVAIDEQLPKMIMTDEVRLRQILFNVVGNAIKFTEFGSVQIAVRRCENQINPSPDKLCLEITISDTGIGISEENKKNIFDAFTQSEGQSNRKYGGTGLGLAITQRLVHLLGGTIHLESECDRGSTFTFYFPEVEPVEIESNLTKKFDADINLQQFQPATILVVDDVQSNRDLIAGYFAATKHELLMANDGEEAIRLAQIYHPDVIFMDLRMPRMDGREAVHFLKENESTRSIPIVILTASPQHQNEQDLKELCEGFLGKPVSQAQIVAELKKFLDPIRVETIPESASPSPVSCDATSPTVRLPELITKLRQEVETTWPELRETLVARDLKKFIQRLESWGNEHQCSTLLDYVETLNQQLQAFDWERIPQTVRRFGELCDRIEESEEG
ncbi:MAG: PAS domain-containing protein [Limnospira sp.]